MKILLAQAEIAQIVQQALVDYISQKLVISDGTEIQVTMTDDGATIDLIQTTVYSPPAGATTKKAAPAKVETPKAETNVKAFAPKKLVPAPVVAEPVVETESVPFDVEPAAVEEAVTVTETANTNTAEPEADAIEEEAADVPAPPARSLFANLRKPVN
jgi:hypothetical protein